MQKIIPLFSPFPSFLHQFFFSHLSFFSFPMLLLHHRPPPTISLFLLYQCGMRAQSISCVQLCDPMDCSPPGCLCPWDFPGKNTGVGCYPGTSISCRRKSSTGELRCPQICLFFLLRRMSHSAQEVIYSQFLGRQ